MFLEVCQFVGPKKNQNSEITQFISDTTAKFGYSALCSSLSKLKKLLTEAGTRTRDRRVSTKPIKLYTKQKVVHTD